MAEHSMCAARPARTPTGSPTTPAPPASTRLHEGEEVARVPLHGRGQSILAPACNSSGSLWLNFP